MQLTIALPDWMVRDFTNDEQVEFNSEFCERVILAYYREMYDPLSGQRTKVALGGDF